ncbi:MAG TPA: dihydroorotase [Candidatus Limnocylindria bacterium]|jgi:dihydroorotase|nr:dihydroorotase [Candidatus Limnocylindria bacterium]
MQRGDLEAKGYLVTPGFVDLHAHLREPGFEESETLASGARAALRGGFTTICAMPNTEPAIDSPGLVAEVIARGRAAAAARVLPIATVTRGRAGRELADLIELSAAGAVAFSDDGSPVDDARLFRHALEYARTKDLLIIEHAQDMNLSGKGVMHEGVVSARLGLPGSPSASEESAVARDLAIAEMAGARLHLTHVSTRGAIASIRDAKKRGLRVTCDVTPHHLAMTDDWVGGSREFAWERGALGVRVETAASASGPKGERERARFERRERPAHTTATPYDSSTKVNPPLRSWSDVRALWEGLADGTVDAIATDHAPHASVRKDVEFDQAAFGISGLETALSLVLGGVSAGWCDRDTVIRALTSGPARVLGIAVRDDDWIAIDLHADWTVSAESLVSLGKNTPLLGRTLRGRVVYAVVGGDVRYEGGLRGATPVGSR